MELIPLDMRQVMVFLLLLVRCAVILHLLPFFGSHNWPAQAKAGLALVLALILFPLARLQGWPFPTRMTEFGLLLVSEVLVALCLGLAVHLVLAGIQIGGQLIGFQMGFGIVNVIDPQSGTQVSVVAQIAYLAAVLIFLSLNGHHVLIAALAESVTLVRPGQITLGPGLLAMVMKLSGQMFILGVKLVAPALAALLFIQTAMGIVAKAVPQVNILIVSFPLTIGVGLFFFGFSFHLVSHFLSGFVTLDLAGILRATLSSLGGR